MFKLKEFPIISIYVSVCSDTLFNKTDDFRKMGHLIVPPVISTYTVQILQKLDPIIHCQ